VEELKTRFAEYMSTKDDSRIPGDLFRRTIITVRGMPSDLVFMLSRLQAVKYGGRQEYEFAKTLYENPTTPPSKSISAV
jgi:aminopeptidase 2